MAVGCVLGGEGGTCGGVVQEFAALESYGLYGEFGVYFGIGWMGHGVGVEQFGSLMGWYASRVMCV